MEGESLTSRAFARGLPHSRGLAPWNVSVRGQRKRKKKTPPIAVCNSSFELFRNRWSPVADFRLPVKACRLRARTDSHSSQTTVQGHSFLSRAWQGKLFPISASQRTDDLANRAVIWVSYRPSRSDSQVKKIQKSAAENPGWLSLGLRPYAVGLIPPLGSPRRHVLPSRRAASPDRRLSPS